MGLLWLTNLSWKAPPSFDCDPGEGQGLCYWMEQMVEHSQIGLHAEFVEEVALPNYEVFGYVVYLGEALTGLLLVLGLFTRFAGLVGLLMSLNLYIGLANAPGEWVWSYAMMALLHLVILALAAGRYFGLDAVLHERFTRARGARGAPLALAGALAT
jgi:thiosulfate dehydrogenase [quinone] large subunit